MSIFVALINDLEPAATKYLVGIDERRHFGRKYLQPPFHQLHAHPKWFSLKDKINPKINEYRQARYVNVRG
jgi:hypothetical protein